MTLLGWSLQYWVTEVHHCTHSQSFLRHRFVYPGDLYLPSYVFKSKRPNVPCLRKTGLKTQPSTNDATRDHTSIIRVPNCQQGQLVSWKRSWRYYRPPRRSRGHWIGRKFLTTQKGKVWSTLPTMRNQNKPKPTRRCAAGWSSQAAARCPHL